MQERYLRKIIEVIDPDTRVLDLGCGNGELLDMLVHYRQVKGYGIDISHHNILDCVHRGLSVFQGNIDEGLPEFSDQSFDYVILSQTLQEVTKPLVVLNEMMRVGKKAIVAFPNFSFWSMRVQILFGRLPKTKLLPYEWYETPNIRLVNIKQFKKVCRDQKFNIIKESPIYPHRWMEWLFSACANLFAVQGIYVISKEQ